MGASHADGNVMSAHIRALEYRSSVTKDRNDTTNHRAMHAMQNRFQLREQFDELVELLTSRLRR